MRLISIRSLILWIYFVGGYPWLSGQVLTASLYGTVQDQTEAVLPGADITLTNEGTGNIRRTVSTDNGEFALEFLPLGSYTLRIEMPGFKTYVQTAIQLTASEVLRQTYALELGELAETVRVEGGGPLVNTASIQQRERIDSLQVQELPLRRRNLTNILGLTTGVSIGQGRQRGVRMNGVGKQGTAVTVDGTDATAVPMGNSFSMDQSRNYIDVLSLDAVQEVQVMRGILPAEYGEVVGGQVNIISKSGTNELHGSLFENYESHAFSARHPFFPSRNPDGTKIDQNKTVFNQFGAALGGPVLRDRVFFFFTYEGYREARGATVGADVPTQAFREEIREALPVPETDLLLDAMPLPNIPFDEDVGTFEAEKTGTAREDHLVLKSDWLVTSDGNLSATYTRNRPRFFRPSAHNGNDRLWSNDQDHTTLQYIAGGTAWTSETRFGYNRVEMNRLDGIFEVRDPNRPEENLWGRRLPYFRVRRLFTGPRGEIFFMEGPIYNLDQKISYRSGRHSIKFGGRYTYRGGQMTNTETPRFTYNGKADLLENRPNSVRPTFGSADHRGRQYSFALFIQDAWRISARLTLDLGLRYNFLSNYVVNPRGPADACICIRELPTDWRKFDFGALRDPGNPFEHDKWVNLGPRLGFAYNLDGHGKTVIRAGFGMMYSPHVPGVIEQFIGDPIVPSRVSFRQQDIPDLALKWPLYNDDLRPVAEDLVRNSGLTLSSSLLDPGLESPYSMHYQLNLQQALGRDLMFEVGYAGVRGVKFIMHRPFNQADRITGIRPNPPFIPGPFYIDNSQQTNYNSLQTSLRRRFSRSLAFDVHYTWGKALATAGGDIGAPFQGDAAANFQDFFDFASSRGPATGDVEHSLVADWIYFTPSLPRLNSALLRNVLGGWELSGILRARSGLPSFFGQDCAGDHTCRPDHLGGDVVLDNWRDNETPVGCREGASCPIEYIDVTQLAVVPVAETGIAVRPGTSGMSLVRTPGAWTVDLSLAKNFHIREGARLQFRVDLFNALNHVNLGGFRRFTDRSRFGQINRISGPMRRMQMALRLVF